MSPEERQLLQGLFDRMRNNAGTQRDAEAERMIADNVRQQPYAPYLLAQTVLVQDQALQAANARLQDLEAQVRDQQGQSGGGGGGFLSGLFGGGQRQAPPPVPQQRPVWNQGGAPQGGYPGGGFQGGGYPPPPPQAGPWGAGGGAAPAGGGFLHGALQTAAGVAGGVMLADGIRSLFGGHNNPMGIASGVPGVGGDTVVNNYYGDGGSSADYRQDAGQDADFLGGGDSLDAGQDADQDQDMAQDAADYGSDDSFDV